MACENKIEILENTLLRLIVRRGLESERTAALLDDGELGYTTDTKRLWIGDGVNAGGSVAGNLFRGCVADQTAVNAITDSVEGDIVYNIADEEISVWEDDTWKVISAAGGSVDIVDNGNGTTNVDGVCLLNCDSIIVDNNDGTATVTTPAGDVTLLTGDSICNIGPQTLTFSNPLTYDNELGQNALLNLTGDTNLNTILNTDPGSQGILTVVQQGSGTPFALGSSMTVMAGDLTNIASLPQGGIAKIAWETHNGTNFYLWVTTPQ